MTSRRRSRAAERHAYERKSPQIGGGCEVLHRSRQSACFERVDDQARIAAPGVEALHQAMSIEARAETRKSRIARLVVAAGPEGHHLRRRLAHLCPERRGADHRAVRE